MRTIPLEARYDDSDHGNGEIRTCQVYGNDPLRSDRPQAPQLPIHVAREVVGIEVGSMAKSAWLCVLREGIEQGRTEPLVRRLRVVRSGEIVAIPADVGQ